MRRLKWEYLMMAGTLATALLVGACAPPSQRPSLKTGSEEASVGGRKNPDRDPGLKVRIMEVDAEEKSATFQLGRDPEESLVRVEGNEIIFENVTRLYSRQGARELYLVWDADAFGSQIEGARYRVKKEPESESQAAMPYMNARFGEQGEGYLSFRDIFGEETRELDPSVLYRVELRLTLKSGEVRDVIIQLRGLGQYPKIKREPIPVAVPQAGIAAAGGALQIVGWVVQKERYTSQSPRAAKIWLQLDESKLEVGTRLSVPKFFLRQRPNKVPNAVIEDHGRIGHRATVPVEIRMIRVLRGFKKHGNALPEGVSGQDHSLKPGQLFEIELEPYEVIEIEYHAFPASGVPHCNLPPDQDHCFFISMFGPGMTQEYFRPPGKCGVANNISPQTRRISWAIEGMGLLGDFQKSVAITDAETTREDLLEPGMNRMRSLEAETWVAPRMQPLGIPPAGNESVFCQGLF